MKRELGITVRDALEEKLLGKTRVVAGHKGLERVITQVNIMEVPDILNWVKEGELLLTTVYSIKDDKRALEELIPKLNEKGLAGLGIKPGRYIKDIPMEMIIQADELNFPLLELPFEVSFTDIINPVLNEIFNKQAAFLKRLEDVHQKFMDVVLEGGGLQEIADTLSTIVNNPVLIKDYISENTAFSSCNIEGLNLRDLFHEADEQMPLPDYERFFYCYDELEGKRVKRVITPIVAGKKDYGAIYVWEIKGSLRGYDFSAIERCSTIAALEMIKEQAVVEVETRYKNEFIDDLLSGDIRSQKAALERARFFNWDLTRTYTVMIISFLNLDPFFNGDGKGDILHQNQKNRVLRYVHAVLQNKKINAIIGNKSDSIILLLPAGGVTGREDIKAAVFNLAGQFLKAIDQGAPDLKAVIGIGRHYSSVLELWKSFQEAKKAVEIGKNVSEGRIIHFDDLGVFRLLYNFASDKEIRQFYDEFARPIVEYDKKHGTELTKTLETFYECNGNLKKVSEKLYTHYNTILYRIQRIQEIIGVNLEKASDRLSVEIALKLMKVMEYKQT